MASADNSNAPNELSYWIAALAIGLGVAGIVFVSQLGFGAPAGFLLTLIVSTGLLLWIGGKRRASYVAIFAVVFFQINLIQGRTGYGFSEWIWVIAISLVVPIGAALFVTNLAKK